MDSKYSFDVLFSYNCTLAKEKILPLVQSCIQTSKNEKEVLRAIEIGFKHALESSSVNELEENIFRFACPSAKNIFLGKIKILENLDFGCPNFYELCIQQFDVCTDIISHFQSAFGVLENFSPVSITLLGTLLPISVEILLYSFEHCKNSQNIYGSYFESLTSCLSNFFKKCTEFLDKYSEFLVCNLCIDSNDNESGGKILNKVLVNLSKCGFALLNLEVKSTIKVWKTYNDITEKYLTSLKNVHNIGETINCLCSEIIAKIEKLFHFYTNDNKNEANKVLKIACFYLKLVVKFCKDFNDSLMECQKSLLELLLILCRCSISKEEATDWKIDCWESFKQLFAAAEPLLLQLISQKKLVKQCSNFVEKLLDNKNRSLEFSILCCLILKQLIHCNKVIKNLWFGENDNILKWLFQNASSGQFFYKLNPQFLNITISGNQKTFVDLYEYALVTTSAFLTTLTFDEFYLVEKMLIKNLLQSNLSSALFAMDLWCLLNRFSNSELSTSHIKYLSKVFQQLKADNSRVEKHLLKFLIFRLRLPFITFQKENQLKLCMLSLHLDLLENDEMQRHDFNLDPEDFLSKNSQSNYSIMCLFKLNNKCLKLNNLNESGMFKIPSETQEKFEDIVVNLWKFNIQLLLDGPPGIKYVRNICTLFPYIRTKLTPENLYMILCQMKKIVSAKCEPGMKLYLIKVIKSLSSLKIPQNYLTENIVAAIAEIFRHSLLSEQVLIKQKTLETFYSFSQMTSHQEIISLSVLNCPPLKILISEYFKKELIKQSDFSVRKYLLSLHLLQYNHLCTKKKFRTLLGPEELNVENKIIKWKEYGNEIRNSIEILTESQKNDIKEFAKAVLLLFD